MSKVWFVLPMIAGYIIARTVSQEKSMNSSYNTNVWTPLLIPLAAAKKFDLRYVSKWLDMESGGQPCAIGKPGAKGTPGPWPTLPREMGIAQLYNPDDFQRFGVDPNHLRAYCSKDGSATCTRLLTAQEMQEQVNLLFQLMEFSRAYALKYLAAVGSQWDDHGIYCMTKLVHGLPGLVNGIVAVKAHLGHAPSNWSEYRAAIKVVKLDSGTEKYRSEFDRVFGNAEECASVVLT